MLSAIVKEHLFSCPLQGLRFILAPGRNTARLIFNAKGIQHGNSKKRGYYTIYCMLV
jgi:hypothetical protein